MHRNDQDEQYRYGQQGDGNRSQAEGSEWEDEQRGGRHGREENQWRSREDQSYGASRRGRHGSESDRSWNDGRGASGSGRRSSSGSWSGRQSAGGYEGGSNERDPGRDFGSEGYGVESEQDDRSGQYGRGQGGQSYGGWQRPGGQSYGPGQSYSPGQSYGSGQNFGRRQSYGSGQRYGQRGFGSQGSEGGFGGEGAGSASGRGYGSYDESGQYGSRSQGYSEGAHFLEQRRNQQGRFAGRGPKGYERSDDRIREDVCDRLMAEAEVDASEVSVQVKSGEVTLEGTVESKHCKRLVEDIAEEVSGVREVTNRLRVERGEWGGATSGGASMGGSSRGTSITGDSSLTGGSSAPGATTAAGATTAGSKKSS